MYLKFGNILAVSNVCSLPWSELKTGDHIILFERTSEPHQDEMQDRAVHMVLYRKQHERFFSFHCHSVHTVVEREYDLDTYEQTDEYGFIEKSDESERHYVILSDGKPYLLPTVKQDVRYNADLFRKVASQDLPNESDSLGRLVSHLYSGSRRVGYMHAEMSYYSCDLQSSGYVYLILPIANDIAVLLALRVEVYAGGYCLTRDIEFAILTTNNVYMATYDPGKEFLSDFTEAYLKSQSSGSFREENERNVSMFLDAVEVFYANSVSLHKENMLNQLERHLDRMVPYSSLMSVFKNPFYVNESLQIKAYPSIFDESFILFKGDEPFLPCNGYCMEGKYPEMEKEFVKASAMFNFLFHGKNGLNPKDGNLYRDGQLVEDDSHMFKNNFGIRIRGNLGDLAYYVNCDGYYVPVDRSDKKTINRIESEFKLFQRLQEQIGQQ